MTQEANASMGTDGPSPIDGADWDLPDDVLASLGEETEEESEQEPEEAAVEDDATDEGTSDEEDEVTEDTDDEEETESEEAVAEPFTWDGNPDTLPDALKPTHLQMVRGYGIKMEEAALQRKELAAAIAEAKKAPESAVAEDGPPPVPTFEDNEETFNAKQAALTQWHVKKAIEQERQTSSIGVDRVAALEQKMTAEAISTARAKETGRDDHSPAVEAMVRELVNSNPLYFNQPATPETIASIYELARDKVELKTRKTSSANHKATANKRAVTRPGKKAVKNAARKEVFARSLDDAVALAVEAAAE